MRFLFLLCFVVMACGAVGLSDKMTISSVDYVVESSDEESEGYVIIKLSDSHFDIGHENVLGYDYKRDECVFSLNYEEELHPVFFFNELCDVLIDKFCVIKDGLGLHVECHPIGALPESMRGKLNRVRDNIFKNEEVQEVLSCFKSMTLFGEDFDISECEKGVF